MFIITSRKVWLLVSFPPASYRLFLFIWRRMANACLVIGMKINIDELTYEEIKEVVDRLRSMKIETKFRRLGASIILQTENGPVQVAQNEAVEMLGVQTMF